LRLYRPISSEQSTTSWPTADPSCSLTVGLPDHNLPEICQVILSIPTNPQNQSGDQDQYLVSCWANPEDQTCLEVSRPDQHQASSCQQIFAPWRQDQRTLERTYRRLSRKQYPKVKYHLLSLTEADYLSFRTFESPAGLAAELQRQVSEACLDYSLETSRFYAVAGDSLPILVDPQTGEVAVQVGQDTFRAARPPASQLIRLQDGALQSVMQSDEPKNVEPAWQEGFDFS
jgi:hypothetical protein